MPGADKESNWLPAAFDPKRTLAGRATLLNLFACPEPIWGADMRRRELVLLIGGGATWPFVARAQQAAMPVIGLLGSATAKGWTRYVSAFQQGLRERGYVEGRNVVIEARWADAQYDRLPAMAAELVQRQVTLMVAFSTPAARAAKAATTTIPIVFFRPHFLRSHLAAPPPVTPQDHPNAGNKTLALLRAANMTFDRVTGAKPKSPDLRR
jgi:hypothetical protein